VSLNIVPAKLYDFIAKLLFNTIVCISALIIALISEVIFCYTLVGGYFLVYSINLFNVDASLNNCALNILNEYIAIFNAFIYTINYAFTYISVIENLMYFCIVGYGVAIVTACLFFSFLGLRGVFRLLF
jgi:hypothetical protein